MIITNYELYERAAAHEPPTVSYSHPGEAPVALTDATTLFISPWKPPNRVKSQLQGGSRRHRVHTAHRVTKGSTPEGQTSWRPPNRLTVLDIINAIVTLCYINFLNAMYDLYVGRGGRLACRPPFVDDYD